MTKKEALTRAIEIVEANESGAMVMAMATDSEVLAVLANEIESIEKKAIKAKEKAMEKKAESDEMADAIKAILTDESMSINSILADLDEKFEATPAKVAARLKKLVDETVVVKEDIKADGRKIKGYHLA